MCVLQARETLNLNYMLLKKEAASLRFMLIIKIAHITTQCSTLVSLTLTSFWGTSSTSSSAHDDCVV